MERESRRSGGPGRRPALTLASFLPYRLNVVATVVSEGLARLYGERFGIGIPEWRVLATVGEFRSITAKAVGAHARMGKVKVSRAVGALEARGLVSRAPNAQDRREAFLTLTEGGKAVYREIVPLALAYQRELMAGLSASEEARLGALIDRLLARAGEMDPVFDHVAGSPANQDAAALPW